MGIAPEWILLRDEVIEGLTGWEPGVGDAESLAELALLLRELASAYKGAADLCDEHIGYIVDTGRSFNVGSYEVTPRKTASRTKWQNDDLLRAVLDSRLIDFETGEITEETPLEKIRHVFALSGGSARITALKDRGIDADEYCSTEWRSTVSYRK